MTSAACNGSRVQEHCKHYTRELERSGAFVLTIWPEHCIKGSAGYEVVPELQTALRSWSDRQGKAVRFVNKGMNELTEMYSALQAELPMVDDPSTQLNTELIDQLRQSNKLVVCGQALSHCVNWTVRHLVSHWSSRDPADIIILTDGTILATLSYILASYRLFAALPFLLFLRTVLPLLSASFRIICSAWLRESCERLPRRHARSGASLAFIEGNSRAACS